MSKTMTRALGRSGIIVSAVGLGGWAIGGPFSFDGKPDGWGEVDDDQSARAIALALEMGVTLFDTADVYGTGHGERILGNALRSRRRDVAIATKFGFTYDEAGRAITGTSVAPDYIRKALEASLSRLGTDYVDLYQIHVGDLDRPTLDAAAETLEELATAGRIRAWGWSTDDAALLADAVAYPHFAAVQQEFNVLVGARDVLEFAESHDLASLSRSPLAMGLLTGKYAGAAALPAADVRTAGHSWVRYFRQGLADPEFSRRLAAIRDLLQSGGRTLAQGALGWLLARSPAIIPIPGFKTEAQAADNAGALEKGPLAPATMAEIAGLLEEATP